jgi:hypothetical protein
LQGVTAQPHEDLPVLVKLSPVSIKDVSVARIEDKKTGRAWLSLSFVLVFSLEEKAARNFVLDEFGKTLLWTFEGLQRELLNEAALHDRWTRALRVRSLRRCMPASASRRQRPCFFPHPRCASSPSPHCVPRRRH